MHVWYAMTIPIWFQMVHPCLWKINVCDQRKRYYWMDRLSLSDKIIMIEDKNRNSNKHKGVQ
jgi:hypothetical protein